MERLLIFSRWPEVGKVKTRLIPVLGAERANRVHQLLMQQTFDIAATFQSRRSVTVEVHHTGGDDTHGSTFLGSHAFDCRVQQGADLGARLEAAVTTAFADHTQHVVIIGTDCPDLTPEILATAFESLARADLVIGPAMDGGYYLIGLRRPTPELFHGIDWGTDRVLAQTLSRARELGYRVHQLAPLSDVDYPADLIACRRQGSYFSDVFPNSIPGLISIVIPTWNEAQHLEATLRPLVGQSDIEVIVADGGSTDRTVEIARQLIDTVLVVQRGRGSQMNAGAAMARGEVILFLHADTRLPRDFPEQVWSVLNHGAVAGAFPLHIDDPRGGFRWIEWGANLRSRYLQRPYGDQALFVRAELFFRLGGFPHWPLLEDSEFCRKLRRQGRIRLAATPVQTSARRWTKLGLWRTTLRNQLILIGYQLGVSPERLSQWYTSYRGRKS